MSTPPPELPRSKQRRQRGWTLALAVLVAVWAFRGFIELITPGNPNPYLTPLALGATLLALGAPLLRTGRFGRSRTADVSLVLASPLVLSAGLIEVLPPVGGLHRGALLAHLVVGLAVLLPLHWYLFAHLSEAIRRRPVALVRGGVAALAITLGCAWTGALLLFVQAKQMAILELPHRVLGWVLVLAVAAHVVPGRRVLTQRGEHAPVRRRFASLAGLGALPVLAALAAFADAPAPWTEPAGAIEGAGLTNASTAHGELLADGPWTWSPATCSSPGGYCHVDTVQQWARTTHAQSNNPAYQLALREFRADRPGKERYCQGCHEPRRALSDAPPGPRSAQAEAHGWTLGNPTSDPAKPEGPPFGFEYADGVGCLVCHGARPRSDVEGTGSYVLSPAPGEVVHTGDIPFFNFPMVLAELAEHRDAFFDPSLSDETGCATCHRHRVPDAVHPAIPGLDIADKVEPWRAYGGEDRCQDCHMPRVYGPVDPTWTRSHAFPSGNTGVAAVQRNPARVAEQEAFLKDRLTLAVSCGQPTPAGDRAQIPCRVAVTNEGVGHRWPAGPPDLVDAWVAADVLDGTGAVLISRGVLGPGHQVIEAIVDWRKRMTDDQGQPLYAHQFWKAASIEGRDGIGPGATDRVDVVLELPPELAGRASTVAFRLLQRRYHADFAALAFGPDVELPVTELAAATATVGGD